MSIDNSLKRGSRLVRARNVLKRGERIDQMKSDDRWNDECTALGLPKTRVIKLATGKKKKKEKKEEEGDAKGGKGAKGKK